MNKELTVNQLHKLLGKLVASGRGRLRVSINKRTFTHPLEGDGVCIMPVGSVEVQQITMIDGDGFTEFTKRGVECSRMIAVLRGPMTHAHKSVVDDRSVTEFLQRRWRDDNHKDASCEHMQASNQAVRDFAEHIRNMCES